MLIGLGTGSAGTAVLAKRLDLPHERHWLPWEVDLVALDAALPEVRAAGGEVGLYLLPYVEAILHREPAATFVCMQRDAGRTVRGLARKLGGNPFAIPEDAARFHHGFPFYGSVTVHEGAARFYRSYYARAYQLQKRYPDHFRVFFTDHVLGATVPDVSDAGRARFAELCKSVQQDFDLFCQEPA